MIGAGRLLDPFRLPLHHAGSSDTAGSRAVSACAPSGAYAPEAVAEAHELQEGRKAIEKVLIRLQNSWRAQCKLRFTER
jgi:hypothetical protein